MSKFADNHTFNYIATLGEFRKSYPEDHCPSWVKITTITIISKFLQEIDIPKLKNHYMCSECKPKYQLNPKHQRCNMCQSISIKIKMKGSTFDGFEWKMKDTTFFNQATLGYTDQYSTKSIKVFPNGSVQVAGCSDLFDCKRVIKQLTFILKTVLEVDIPSNGFRVVMINTNFSLNYNINLMETARIFGEDKIFTSVTFDPDRYSAVKIKFKPAEDMKQVTTSIFSTGKIIVTGAETLKEIAFAYNVINRHINAHADQIKVSKTVITDVFDTVYGYKIEDCIKYIEKNGYSPWTFTRSNVPINF
jgi:TATA-box binding protein (TBP) (component of TFIID and TFIIIB)